jgi:S-formylglutathione hydrolase FrmB
MEIKRACQARTRENAFMRNLRWLIAALALGSAVPELCDGKPCNGKPFGQLKFQRVQSRLAGQVLDFTHNHGADRRIWSAALGCKRDFYVYLPPCFDPEEQYPLMLYLHGFSQDETFFQSQQVELLDRAIADGALPPMIIAAPDGSIKGRPSYYRSFSMFANTRIGNYEDYLLVDVWDFLMENFPIRPEPEAHALVGVSLGGGAAFRLAIEHQDRFKVCVGFFPALNLRWVDCHGRYRGKFDPDCWGWRERVKAYEAIGRYAGIPIPARVFLDSLIPRGQAGIEEMARLNPIELLDAYDVKDGDLAMFVAYAGRDQFNIDTQVESFLYRAVERGIHIDVVYDPRGRHDVQTGVALFPAAVAWLAERIRPYSPHKSGKK